MFNSFGLDGSALATRLFQLGRVKVTVHGFHHTVLKREEVDKHELLVMDHEGVFNTLDNDAAAMRAMRFQDLLIVTCGFRQGFAATS